MKRKAVTIDGPAGSGKSTVARQVAERLGYTYIDTGAMYRALTLKVMLSGVDMDDEEGIVSLSAAFDFAYGDPPRAGEPQKYYLDGRDVSADIRRMEVTVNVKHVCRIPEVRRNLVGLQRKIASRCKGVVMEGRDTGTVVLADAACKVYLDASFDERVERRLAELRAKGEPVSREDVASDLKARDHADRTRKTGPLVKAGDAVLLDTTDLDVDEVVSRIVSLAGNKPR